MTAFAESNENSGLVPRLAALTGRMADLEETLKNQIAAVRSGVSEDVESRLAKVAETSEAARSGTQRMDRQLSGVANDTARLSQQIETVKADTTRLGDTLRVVQEETAKITSQLSRSRRRCHREDRQACKPHRCRKRSQACRRASDVARKPGGECRLGGKEPGAERQAHRAVAWNLAA